MTSKASLLYTEEEESLRDTVRMSMARRCPQQDILGIYDGQYAAEAAAWEVLKEIGLVGLLVDERFGGVGGTLTDAGLVMEELGYAAAPAPFLASSVIATMILNSFGDGETLQRIAGGEIAVLVLPAERMLIGRDQPFRVDGNGLIGSAVTVSGGAVADILLVPVPSRGCISLHIVEARALGVGVARIPALDMTRGLADITLDGVSSRCASHDSASVINRALTIGAAVAASDQLGIAQWCLDQLHDYLLLRHQFGRPIGSFQAIKHRMADLWVEVELLRTAARNAVATTESDEIAQRAHVAHLAQGYSSDAVVHVAEEAIQLHAGIAMTWEHPAHLYLKRAKASQIALGRPALHRMELGKYNNIASPS